MSADRFQPTDTDLPPSPWWRRWWDNTPPPQTDPSQTNDKQREWIEREYRELEAAARDRCQSVGIDPDECPYAGLTYCADQDKPWWKYAVDDLAVLRLNLSVLQRYGLVDVGRDHSQGAATDDLRRVYQALKDNELKLLECHIATWHERELEAGNVVPDFWDDCNASDRLATYLTERGWHQ